MMPHYSFEINGTKRWVSARKGASADRRPSRRSAAGKATSVKPSAARTPARKTAGRGSRRKGPRGKGVVRQGPSGTRPDAEPSPEGGRADSALTRHARGTRYCSTRRAARRRARHVGDGFVSRRKRGGLRQRPTGDGGGCGAAHGGFTEACPCAPCRRQRRPRHRRRAVAGRCGCRSRPQCLRTLARFSRASVKFGSIRSASAK
jgi:hypothetical protein